MILDSSAIAAIFLHEPECERLLVAIADAQSLMVSAATFLEVGIVLSHRKGRPMQYALEEFFAKMSIEVVPFTNEHREIALRAWWQHGRTRSVANLNFGDCISYATAVLAAEPLLCKGDDFRATDIELAPW